MFSSILLALVLILYVIFFFFFVSRRTSNRIPYGAKLAPLERGWPILGILPNVVNPLCHYLLKIGEKHGSLFRIRFGMREAFVLNNYSVLKKCLRDDGDNFSGRLKSKLLAITTRKCGLITVDGHYWAKHKAFLLKVMREHRQGKSINMEIVQEECRHLVNELQSMDGKIIDFSKIIPIYITNIISKFIMSKRYERNDDDLNCIMHLADNILHNRNLLMTLHFLFPFLDESTIMTRIGLYLFKVMPVFEKTYDVFRKQIKEHRHNLDFNFESKDLVNRYLIEQAQLEQDESVESFTEFQLIRSSLELFIAGYETTSTTLGWGLLFLSKYQEIQKRMHDEIYSLIGLDELPSMIDRKSLPLSHAIMNEIMRLGSMLPFAVTHRNFKAAVVDGIFIPANSIIFPNLYACHRDATVWEKPFDFYPEHFLSKTDEGLLKYNPRDEFLPFSIGKRQCLGESLAITVHFIFLISIIQRFKVRFAVDISENEYQEAIIGGNGAIRSSKIKDFVFEKYE